MLKRIDGFLGRLVFRFLGLVATGIGLAAAYAAYQTLISGDGLKSIVAFLMFGAGAAIAAFTARYCFSGKRTFGDFIQAIEGSDAEMGPERPRKSS
jgi:ascorbate-specific PTS system EIIC-type component UlaA